jgi:hypothetical protein
MNSTWLLDSHVEKQQCRKGRTSWRPAWSGWRAALRAPGRAWRQGIVTADASARCAACSPCRRPGSCRGVSTSIALGTVPGSTVHLGSLLLEAHTPNCNSCGGGWKPRAWSALKPSWPVSNPTSNAKPQSVAPRRHDNKSVRPQTPGSPVTPVPATPLGRDRLTGVDPCPRGTRRFGRAPSQPAGGIDRSRAGSKPISLTPSPRRARLVRLWARYPHSASSANCSSRGRPLARRLRWGSAMA